SDLYSSLLSGHPITVLVCWANVELKLFPFRTLDRASVRKAEDPGRNSWTRQAARQDSWLESGT
ncbi:MAG: hypothetical protein OXF88_06865, partial [Rhodobacteraceae bacterium]|nr:hypothetical protein [Paracoccaceae bacterium]